MTTSVCITVFNEEGSIAELLEALLGQTKKPDEITIVDAASTDQTLEIIKSFAKKVKRIKFISRKCSRAEGRNLSIELSTSSIIAMTDAGCLPHKDWLEKITTPFENKNAEVVAGFYTMTYRNDLQKAMQIYMGITPEKFTDNFLPSTRSVAFTREVWEKVGGFNENLTGAAEDTEFNYRLLKEGVKIRRVKNAIVEWGMAQSISEFYFSIINYAKGDAQTRIFSFPTKDIMSHNIHAIFVLLRSLIGVLVVTYSLVHDFTFLPVVLVTLYLYSSFRKVGPWGVILQPISDFGVIMGFINGLLQPRI